MTRTRHVARRASRSQDGLARFSLLDTLRQYCLDRLDDEARSTARRITSSNAHTSGARPRITVGERSTQLETYLRRRIAPDRPSRAIHSGHIDHPQPAD